MNLHRFLDILSLRLRSLFRRQAVERDMERELSFHIEQQRQENLAAGMDPTSALHAAKRSFGGAAQIQEECRDMRFTNHLEFLWNDIRYAVRTMVRTPGFTIIIVLTLALAAGANSAIFSVVQGVLLRPLPYPEPEQLVRIYFQSDSQPKFPLNPNDFRDFRSRNRTFESMAAINRSDRQLSGLGGESLMLKGFAVTAGYFQTLGFRPARGREFTTDDELPSRGRVVILSHRLWRTKFAADPAILGRRITLDTEPFEIVGVMPAGTQHPGNNFRAVADGDTVDIWIPFSFDEPKDRGSHYLDGIGRLKSGVSPQQGNADLSSVLTQLMTEHTGKGWRVYLIPLFQETVGRTRSMLTMLFAAVGLLLLIACVNAANLLMARSSARVREMSLRAALGAGRARIVRQLLTESMVLALTALPFATLLTVAGVRVLRTFLPTDFPRAGEIRLDAGVFVFTLSVVAMTGLLFGLGPAFTISRVDLQQTLRESGRSATGTGRLLRFRNILVVVETALACVLLITAGQLLHSFANLVNADPGFRPEQVLTAKISLPRETYRTEQQRIQFWDGLLASLQSGAGVEFAGASSDLPWTGYDGNADGFTIEDHPDAKTTSRYHVASPDFFRALGAPLLRGRFIDSHDGKDDPIVIVVNEAFANRYWPGADPIGKRITLRSNPKERDWIRIIGVVRDIKDNPDSTSVRPGFWLPYTQQPERGMSIVVRSTKGAAQLTSQFRLVARQLDPALAIADLRLMTQIADEALSGQRFALFLVGLFALLALALAACGIYGVISFAANQRMHEFGIRMALGAKPGELVRMMVSQGLRLTAIGTALGMLLAAGSGRLLGSLLYGVGGSDPLAFSGVTLLVLVTTSIACYVPARKAGGADPSISLRSE